METTIFWIAPALGPKMAKESLGCKQAGTDVDEHLYRQQRYCRRRSLSLVITTTGSANHDRSLMKNNPASEFVVARLILVDGDYLFFFFSPVLYCYSRPPPILASRPVLEIRPRNEIFFFSPD